MTAFVWDGVGANWGTDHWGRAGVAPKWPGDTGSDPADTIEIDGSVNDPATQPSTLTVAEYVCYGGSFDSGTALTVTDKLTMGTAWGSDMPNFAGTASAGCVVLFQGGAILTGTAGNGATFDDTAYNDTAGTTGDYTTLNNDTHNAGTTGDYTTLNDTAHQDTLGVCGDKATFNSTAEQAGEFTGDKYYLQASTTFAATAKFTGTPPISFLLTTALGTLMQNGTNPITSDGGTTAIAYTVGVNPGYFDGGVLWGLVSL